MFWVLGLKKSRIFIDVTEVKDSTSTKELHDWLRMDEDIADKKKKNQSVYFKLLRIIQLIKFDQNF